jgi:hypothetical protein
VSLLKHGFTSSSWKDGMVEYWNVVLKGNISLINPPVNKNITQNHYSNFPEPIIPSFQYSN